ncbi:hypothetical protein [Streptomyces sp. B1866]|uniref:hypothetical protein n=1 Tax=Streptomyces sp. B1866 TaxID=3075431 RepID=UPI00289FAF34|nr:hypothetical protein [Streptomyces sp. B1866]
MRSLSTGEFTAPDGDSGTPDSSVDSSFPVFGGLFSGLSRGHFGGLFRDRSG